MPGEELPAPLEVRVTIGEHPIKDASVRFSIIEGNGSLSFTGDKKKIYKRTGPDGLASCGWKLDEDTQSQQVEATLLDVVLLDKDGGYKLHPSIRFNANLSVAGQVAYNPDCEYLIAKEVTTVQAAIDALCDSGFQIGKVLKWKSDEEWVTLGNYTDVLVGELKKGLHIVCNKKVDSSTVTDKLTCYITLYMPRIWKDNNNNNGVIGFQPLILAGDVKLDNSNEEIICWNPTNITKQWLEKILIDMLKDPDVSKVLARLTLKGNFIWAKDGHTLYLDGEAFGMENTDSNLDLPSGDGRRGGDFEMWFWLVGSANDVQ